MKRILGIFLVAILGVIAPVLPAKAEVVSTSTYYVATSGTANLAGGNNCATPNFVGTDQAPIQAALNRAALNNATSQSFTDVGFTYYTGTYTTVVLCEGTWTLSQTLVADANVVIKGSGYKKTIIDGNNTVRIMNVGTYDTATEPVDDSELGVGYNFGGHAIGFASRVQIQDLTLKNGFASGDGVEGYGGAVRVQGRDSFMATRVLFDSNSAVRGSAVMALGNSGDLDEAFEPAGSPSGDVVVDSSAFTGNTSSISGVVEAHRYQRGGTGVPLFQNLSFYRNYASYTLSFGFSDGRSYGNSFVDNQTYGYPELNAGVTNAVRGNVFAQKTSITMCTSGTIVYEDTVSTGPCGMEESTTTVAPYFAADNVEGIDPTGLFYGSEIPVQRFGNLSPVRGAWAQASACPVLDARGASRPTEQNCDSGPLQQASMTDQPQWINEAEYVQNENKFNISVMPSNGTNSEIRFSSGDTKTCLVDSVSGQVTGLVNGASCDVYWEILATSINERDLLGSSSLQFNFVGASVWSATATGFTALHDATRDVSYFVGFNGVVDRLSADGVYTKAWITLPAEDWGGNSWSSTIDISGNLYISAWYGKIAVIAPNGTVDFNLRTYTNVDISALTVSASGDLFLSTCAAETNVITKLTSGNVESVWGRTPAGWCPSYMVIDRQGRLVASDWYQSGILEFDSTGRLVIIHEDPSSGWVNQMAIDTNNNVYVGNAGAGKISKLDATGNFTHDWLALPSGCEPRGITTGDDENLFVACFGTKSILEIDLVTLRTSQFFSANTSLSFNQLASAGGRNLVAATESAIAVKLSIVKESQAELGLSSETLVVGSTAQISNTGGSGSGEILYKSLDQTVCTVSPTGLVTSLSNAVCWVSANKRGDTDFKPEYLDEFLVSFAAAAPVMPPVAPVTPIVNNNSPTQEMPVAEPLVPVAEFLTPITGLKNFTTDDFKSLTAEKIATISVDEAKNITQSKIKSLISVQLKALTVEAVAALKPSVVAAISPSRLKLLTTAQKKALTSAQLKALTKVQRKAVGR